MERQNFCQKLYGIKQKAFRVTLEAILRKYIWEDTPPPLSYCSSSSSKQQALLIQHAALLKVPLKPCTVLDLSTIILFKGPGMVCEAASWRSNRCQEICSVNLL